MAGLRRPSSMASIKHMRLSIHHTDRLMEFTATIAKARLRSR
jgi:hypothetical protein